MPQAWAPAIAPTYRRHAAIKIEIAGRDVTAILDPHLISVDVRLTRYGPHRAFIELDDRDATLSIPRFLDPVQISMGWTNVGPVLPLAPAVRRLYRMFLPDDPIPDLPYRASDMMVLFGGEVEEVESGFAREGGGRRLWIDCSSSNAATGWKSPSTVSMGDGDAPDGGGQDISVVDFLQKVGKEWGVQVIAADAVQNIKRKFWVADGESFQSIGSRLMSELGLGFKMIGNKAFLIDPNKTMNGELNPTVEAIWGINLISWRIKPFASQPQWQQGKQRFFDIFAGLFKSQTQNFGGQIPFGGAQAIASLPGLAPNAQVGGQDTQGMKELSARDAGTGWCVINGEPAAQPYGSIFIQGARPGVDGRYDIDIAEHHYDRGGGYTTRCKLDTPFLNSSDYQQMWGPWPPNTADVLNWMGYLTTPFQFTPPGVYDRPPSINDIANEPSPNAPEPGPPAPPISY